MSKDPKSTDLTGKAQDLLRPRLYEESGDFTVLLHHSQPRSYAEESHETIQVCIPYEGARYDVLRSSHGGSRLTHRLRANDLLVIPQRQPHAVNWLRSADILSLHFTSHFLETVLGAPAPQLRDCLIVHDPLISKTAAELRRAVKGREASPVLLGSCAALIAYRIAKQAAGAATHPAQVISPLAIHERSRIAEYVDANLDKSIKIAELASIVGLSQWHFLRRFHITEGTTPNQYIIRQRMDRACKLLMRSQMSVTQIAMEVGMSPSHFSRSFTRATGVSAYSFRRQRMT